MLSITSTFNLVLQIVYLFYFVMVMFCHNLFIINFHIYYILSNDIL